eukprot:TRINITY_DN7496_c0_g1_i1.p1 TRINITY_DN7496_c0_g1~~TRINITY_DN7496_c0_g1_i1.p1  ORF type:complete len:306 (+),score=63.47 TRINITY_DN7496_c0_g1_i1:3-920(+)
MGGKESKLFSALQEPNNLKQLELLFKKYDKNRDGSLSRSELELFLDDAILHLSLSSPDDSMEIFIGKHSQFSGQIERFPTLQYWKRIRKEAKECHEHILRRTAGALLAAVDDDKNGIVSLTEWKDFDWTRLWARLKLELKRVDHKEKELVKKKSVQVLLKEDWRIDASSTTSRETKGRVEVKWSGKIPLEQDKANKNSVIMKKDSGQGKIQNWDNELSFATVKRWQSLGGSINLDDCSIQFSLFLPNTQETVEFSGIITNTTDISSGTFKCKGSYKIGDFTGTWNWTLSSHSFSQSLYSGLCTPR